MLKNLKFLIFPTLIKIGRFRCFRPKCKKACQTMDWQEKQGGCANEVPEKKKRGENRIFKDTEDRNIIKEKTERNGRAFLVAPFFSPDALTPAFWPF